MLKSTPGFIHALSVAGLLLAACSRPIEEPAAYKAACEGPPLRTAEKRNQAMEDGYEINRNYDCVDKASFVAIAEEKTRWAAANTPEAIAQREAERRKLIEEDKLRRAVVATPVDTAAAPPFELRLVDANTATEAELASVPGVGPVVAAQIVEERSKGRFNGWPDLVGRVIGLRSAQSAAAASIGGLNVDGQSLPGAAPDAATAARINARNR
jgi:DNA uptake protein ComE-like DNA-binding protein